MITKFLRAPRQRVTFVLAALTLIGCSSSSKSSSNDSSTPGGTPTDPVAFGAMFTFADNEVSGWTLSTDPNTSYAHYGTYTDSTLDQRIDGGNMPYIQRGMTLAMYEDLMGPSGSLCTVVAMYFGTADNATTMFNYQKDKTGANIAIGSYDASTAIGYSTLSGVTAYAHFQAYYFETQVSGVADDAAGAQVSAQFLQVLQSKAK